MRVGQRVGPVITAVLLLAWLSACRPAKPDAATITVRGRSDALTTSAAGPAKVLAYRDFGAAQVSPIDADGRFTVDVERSPCGLVFLDAADHLVGNLSLASGIETLPLSMVDEHVGTIDLQTITFANGLGVPAHDPIAEGGEAPLSETERAAYRLQSSLFSAIMRNLDMNRDEVIDVLSDRPYWMMFGADFEGGAPPTADPGVAGPMPSLNVFHFNFGDAHAAVQLPRAAITTPDGGRFEADGQPVVSRDPSWSPYHWVFQTGWSTFAAGGYAIDYGAESRHVQFDLLSPLGAGNFIVAANLWVEMQGPTLHKVHWRWKMLDGSELDATRLLKRDVTVQVFYGDGPNPPLWTQRPFTLRPTDTECLVDLSEEASQKLKAVLVSGNDLFGNSYGTFYAVP